MMNASIRGTMFVKADRLNTYIQAIEDEALGSDQKTISLQDFIKTLNAIQTIVSQELTDKGKEEVKWKELLKKQEN